MGICFMIGRHSKVRIRDDPWIPDLSNFRLPKDVLIPAHLRYVSDLMDSQNTTWNFQLLRDSFPLSFCRIIQSIPIASREQDRLIWNPTSSGEFSVRSCYRLNNYAWFCTSSRLDRKLWLLLWKTTLHERHKILLWRILHNILPTKDQIHGMLRLSDPLCILCSHSMETLDHLLLDCPIVERWWLNSSWQIRIAHFAPEGCTKWIQILLDEQNCLTVSQEEKLKILNYAAVMFDQIWMWRNKIRLGCPPPDWCHAANQLNNIADPTGKLLSPVILVAGRSTWILGICLLWVNLN